HDARPGTKWWELLLGRAWEKAPQRHGHPREEVGHAGDVAEDPVPIHTNERQALIEDLEVDEHRDDDEEFLPRHEVEADRDQLEDHVEVEATEIRAQSGAPAERVRRRDIGVEDRI